ncbi:Homeodomain-like protein, partial [Syncephalastrum racemosum]
MSSLPLKAKRKRASPSQLSVLNRVFKQTYFPSTELRVELGKQLGMSPRTVQIWFQNKRQSLRARERTSLGQEG